LDKPQSNITTTESSSVRFDVPAELTSSAVDADNEMDVISAANPAAIEGIQQPPLAESEQARPAAGEATPSFGGPDTQNEAAKPKKAEAFLFADSDSLTESQAPPVPSLIFAEGAMGVPNSVGAVLQSSQTERQGAPRPANAMTAEESEYLLGHLENVLTAGPATREMPPSDRTQSDFYSMPPGETSVPEEAIEIDPREAEDARLPEENWGREIEWPGQWQSGSTENATAVLRDTNEKSTDELEVYEPEAGLEYTAGRPETVAQPPAPSPSEAPPQSQELTVQGLAPVPVVKPKAPAARSTAAESPGLPETIRWGDDVEWPDQWRK
jgi:hypothetical protein